MKMFYLGSFPCVTFHIYIINKKRRKKQTKPKEVGMKLFLMLCPFFQIAVLPDLIKRVQNK